MTETERIVGQMKAAYGGGAWHGPAVLELLEDVDAATAAAKPVAGAHSIWELVLHLSASADVIRRRIGGESAGMTDEEFWPPVPTPTEGTWKATVDELKQREANLQAAVASFPVDRLDATLVAGKTTSAYENFHGEVQHALYHAGQIALLKKLVRG
ncbi:MAG TPA: DinB family protein [Gemmataceae bacterium]|nr:DinB family protein [Gemmataceae bacterium]